MNFGIINLYKYEIFIIKILIILIGLIMGRKFYLQPLYSLIEKYYSNKIQIIGKKNIPKDNGYVVISNHNFISESLIIRNIFNKNIYIIGQKCFLLEFLDIINISIPYDKNIENIKKSGELIKKIILKKCKFEKKNILVFPEGNLTNINEMLLFKKGLFYICYENNIPIVPIIFLIKKKTQKRYWICVNSKIKVKIFKMMYPKKFLNFNKYYYYIYNKMNNYMKKYINDPNVKYSILI